MAFSSLSTDVIEQINEYNTKNLEFICGYRKSTQLFVKQGADCFDRINLFWIPKVKISRYNPIRTLICGSIGVNRGGEFVGLKPFSCECWCFVSFYFGRGWARGSEGWSSTSSRCGRQKINPVLLFVHCQLSTYSQCGRSLLHWILGPFNVIVND